MRKLHILIDADGTLLDWGSRWDEFLYLWQPESEGLPWASEQRSFNLKEGLPPEKSWIVDKIFDTPGFYRDLVPFDGAVEAYRKMTEAGHRVQIATSPWWTNTTCLQDKSDSVLHHFGVDAQRTMILTSDKTAIQADYLIDDKPLISGHYTKENRCPQWDQILFDQPYNKEVNLPRIVHWNEWEIVLESLEAHTYDRMIL